MGALCASRALTEDPNRLGEEVLPQEPESTAEATPGPRPSVKPYRPGTTSLTELELSEVSEDLRAEPEVRAHARDELSRRWARNQ